MNPRIKPGTFVLFLAANASRAAETGGQPVGQQLAGLLSVIILALCIMVGLACVCVCYTVLTPTVVRSGGESLRSAPLKTFGVGLLAALAFALCGAVAGALGGAGGVLGLVLAVLVTYLSISGLTMTCHCLGDRLLNSLASEKAGYDIPRVAWGAGLLFGVNFLPAVGQIVFAVALVCALGTAVRSGFERRRRRKTPELEE